LTGELFLVGEIRLKRILEQGHTEIVPVLVAFVRAAELNLPGKPESTDDAQLAVTVGCPEGLNKCSGREIGDETQIHVTEAIVRKHTFGLQANVSSADSETDFEERTLINRFFEPFNEFRSHRFSTFEFSTVFVVQWVARHLYVPYLNQNYSDQQGNNYSDFTIYYMDN
jgi:hypothetical protein